jgi:hypothetical protein
MRVGLSLILVVATGCGGAIDSKLLEGDGSSPVVEAGPKADAATDVAPAPDVMKMADVSPPDVTPVMDTAPPPVDTGPPDMGSGLPPVACGATTCGVPAEECCVDIQDGPPTTYTCQPFADADKDCYAMGNTPIECTQAADCPTSICCGTINGDDNAYDFVKCQTTCSGTNPEIIFCQSSSECSSIGGTCGESELLPGYTVCKT